MKKFLPLKTVVAFLLLSFAHKLVADEAPLVYSVFNHEVAIDSLRAGNHDKSGKNDYYFTATVTAILNTKDELKKDVSTRQKLSLAPVKFGETSLEVLSLWEQDPKAPASLSIKIVGDDIRKLISEAMRNFGVAEQDIAIMVDIQMFEKEKTLGYFGKDFLVGTATYFPIPPTKYQVGGRINTKLSITDDKGTDVRFKVTYENLATPVTAASPAPSPRAEAK